MRIIYVLFVCLLWIPAGAGAQDDTERLEASLSEASGSRRLGLLQRLTGALLERSQYHDALPHAREAEALALELGDRRAQADALVSIGYCLQKMTESRQAFDFLSRGILLYDEIGEPERSAFARTCRCLVRSHFGEYSEALEDCFSSHELYSKSDDLNGLTESLNNIGLIYGRLDRTDESLKYLEQALEIQGENGDKALVGRLLNNIGLIYQEKGELPRALDYLERSLKLKRELGDRVGVSRRLCNIAWLQIDLGDQRKAREYFHQALGIAREIDFKRGAASALLGLAELDTKRGDRLSAIALFRQVIELENETGERDSVRFTYRGLADLYSAEGRYREAHEAFKEYERIDREIVDQQKNEAQAEMQTRFETRQKQQEIELLKRENALSAIELERQGDAWRALLAGSVLVLLIVLLLVNHFRLKTRDAMMAESLRREREVIASLREVDKLKNEFLANTSHELRTPLYGMTGLAESLIDGAKGELPAAVKRDLAMIVGSGQRLSHLVGDILDFSKLRDRSLELKIEPVELHALADVVLTLAKPLVGGKPLELVNSVSPGLPAADADANRVQQVLHNLIGNAIKFTAKGRVEVSAQVEDDQLTVTVSDTGIGIPEGKLERIFQSFEQADASTEREYGGTGLGLAISRQLVELHGGRIWAESVSGQGCRFSFTVPISEQDLSSAYAESMPIFLTPVIEIPAAEPVEAARTRAAAGDVFRILTVDDEPVIREVLANHLVPEGYEIRRAAGGEEALKILAGEDIDLILLDVMMPRMSGYEVCRSVRQTNTLEELPIIFLTAKNQVADLAAGFSEGANDYLTKPIAKSELLARVGTHLDLLTASRSRANQVKVLQGLLPICCNCSRIRDEEGGWNQLETYIDAHSEAYFSHGICPTCVENLYPDMAPDEV